MAAKKTKFCITKYELDACWYGRKHGAKPDLNLFSSVMSRYSKWITGLKSIAETQVGSKSLYVKECATDNAGNYLFILWLATSSDNSSIALRIDSPPGATAATQQRKYSDGYIPGVPLYLYVVAKKGIVYTVKPDKSMLGGRNMFEVAVRDFMIFHNGPTQQKLDITTHDGFMVFTERDLVPKKSLPVFRLRQCVNTAVADAIITRAADVKKLVPFVPMAQSIKAPWEKFIDKLWNVAELSIKGELMRNIQDVRYEVNIDLTAKELENLIRCQQHAQGLGRIGFKVKSSEGGRILWTDKIADQATIELAVCKTKGLYSAMKLLNELNSIYCKERSVQ